MRITQREDLPFAFTSVAEAGDVRALRWFLAQIVLIHVIAVQTIMITEAVLNINGSLINIDRSSCRSQECRSSAHCSISSRNQSGNRSYGGIWTGCNLRQLSGSEDQRCGRQALTMTFSFISGKEEGFVLLNWTAD